MSYFFARRFAVANLSGKYNTNTNGGGNMPMVVAPIGVNLRVIKVLADEKTKKHLESLGISINSNLSILSCSGGSVICVIKDGRLALDKSLATKIFVA
ncbi:MAG: FeoA family protein [Clostridia bacterium]